MKLRGRRPIIGILLALTIMAAGCGSSSKSSSTAKSAASPAATSTTSAATSTSGAKAKAKANQVKTSYKPGEFCSSKNENVYKAQNLVCVNGHLKSTSTSKSSASHPPLTSTT